MLHFMIEGGFAMWPLLVFCLVCLGAAIRFAARPDRRWLTFTAAMAVAIGINVAHAILVNVGSVFHALETADACRDTPLVHCLFAGLKESTRPGALAGIFLTPAALAVAIGVFRRGFWSPPAVATTPALAAAPPSPAP